MADSLSNIDPAVSASAAALAPQGQTQEDTPNTPVKAEEADTEAPDTVAEAIAVSAPAQEAEPVASAPAPAQEPVSKDERVVTLFKDWPTLASVDKVRRADELLQQMIGEVYLDPRLAEAFGIAIDDISKLTGNDVTIEQGNEIAVRNDPDTVRTSLRAAKIVSRAALKVPDALDSLEGGGDVLDAEKAHAFLETAKTGVFDKQFVQLIVHELRKGTPSPERFAELKQWAGDIRAALDGIEVERGFLLESDLVLWMVVYQALGHAAAALASAAEPDSAAPVPAASPTAPPAATVAAATEPDSAAPAPAAATETETEAETGADMTVLNIAGLTLYMDASSEAAQKRFADTKRGYIDTDMNVLKAIGVLDKHGEMYSDFQGWLPPLLPQFMASLAQCNTTAKLVLSAQCSETYWVLQGILQRIRNMEETKKERLARLGYSDEAVDGTVNRVSHLLNHLQGQGQE